MIVRDEEAVLEDCLRSVEGLVDEIVVVDTGSSDSTVRIAEKSGARVFRFAWTEDFAAARNAAFSHARGRWILSIDADERVVEGDRATLAPLLDDPVWAALTVRFQPVTGFTRYRERRLFRNDPRIRFNGVIHESIVPALDRVAAEDGLSTGDTDIRIDHVGYDGDQRSKHARNLPLLKARLAAEPGHVYSWHHLGNALEGLGDEEGAVDAWLAGIETVRGKPVVTPLDCLPYIDLLRHREARGAQAGPLLEEALRLFPDSALLAWMRGRVFVAQGRFAEAAPLFEKLAAMDGETFCDSAVAFDSRILGLFSYEALGVCYFKLGRFSESARCFGLAESRAPDRIELKRRRQVAEARARQGS